MIMGQGDAMMAFNDWSYNGMYRYHCKSSRLYTSVGCKESRVSIRNHGDAFDFHAGRYYTISCVFCDCKFCISFIEGKRGRTFR